MPQQESLERGWRCLNCIICETCKEPQPEDCLLVCDKCDRGFHTTCLERVRPPRRPRRPRWLTSDLEQKLNHIPPGTWLCERCVRCQNCGATTPGRKPSDKWTHDYAYCAPCGVLKDKGNMCPVCQGLYADDSDEPMIQCDRCDLWIHATCCDLTPEDYDAFSKAEDEKFFCKRCISSGLVDSSGAPAAGASARDLTWLPQPWLPT